MIFAALFLKTLIPVGTMVMPVNKVMTVALCDGIAGGNRSKGGATSLAIAQAVAPTGKVLGIDILPDLLAATTRRAAQA